MTDPLSFGHLQTLAKFTWSRIEAGQPLVSTVANVQWTTIGRRRWINVLDAALRGDIQYLLLNQLSAVLKCGGTGIEELQRYGPGVIQIFDNITGGVTGLANNDSEARTDVTNTALGLFADFPAPWRQVMESPSFIPHLRAIITLCKEVSSKWLAFVEEVRNSRGIPHVETLQTRFAVVSPFFQRFIRGYALRIWWKPPEDNCLAHLDEAFAQEQKALRQIISDNARPFRNHEEARRWVRHRYGDQYKAIIHFHENGHAGPIPQGNHSPLNIQGDIRAPAMAAGQIRSDTGSPVGQFVSQVPCPDFWTKASKQADFECEEKKS